MAENRIRRINQLVKKELAQIILEEIEFPKGVLVTLTRVESTPNLIETKIFISVMPENQRKKTFQVLNRQVYDLQQKLNKRLQMRPIPKIEFFEEKLTLEAGRIEEILAGLKEEKK